MLQLPRLTATLASPLTPEALAARLATPLDDAHLPQWLETLAGWPGGREWERRLDRLLARLEAFQRQRPLPAAFPLAAEAYAANRCLHRLWLTAAAVHVRSWLARPTGFARLQAVFDCLRRSLCAAALAHQPWDVALWPEIHRLYLDARARAGRRARPFSGADRAYRRLLLLGLADLPGLHPQEVAMLDALSEKWAALTAVERGAVAGWRLDPDTAAPARWVAAGETGWRLELRPLLTMLESHRELAADRGRYEALRQPAETIARPWLEALLHHWQGRSEEAAPAPAGAVWLIGGLAPVFDRLRGRAVPAFPAVREGERWRVTGGSWQVGTLVGVFAAGGQELRQLGVVTRLCQPAAEVVTLEWRGLATRAVTVGVRPAHLPAENRGQRGLLLTETDPPQLLLAAQPLTTATVVVGVEGRHYPVRLTGRTHPALDVLGFRCLADKGQK